MTKLLTWLRANITRLLLALGILAAIPLCIFLYKAGQTKQAIDSSPRPKSKAEVKALLKQVKDLTQQKEQSQQQAADAYASTIAPERDAALRKHLIDSLTTAYHAIPTDTSLANPTAVSAYLRSYRPSDDADL